MAGWLADFSMDMRPGPQAQFFLVVVKRRTRKRRNEKVARQASITTVAVESCLRSSQMSEGPYANFP